jgi:asparagine synthase (glutamine-hydrolysing)
MCGISGFIATSSRDAERYSLQAGLNSMQHRGPDDSGTWREDNAGFGFARLAIVDLSAAGRQPMESRCGRYVIIFNGEVYNFQELRAGLAAKGETFIGHSDTEVLLRLVSLQGFDAALVQLRGMFALALWDRQSRTMTLARDRLGVKPVVYAETERGVVFASEIHTLFALDPALSREPDIESLDLYLSLQYIPAPRSGFKAVRKLPPAHVITLKDGQVTNIRRYWDIDLSRRSHLSFDEACEAVREKVLESTRLRMIADVPLGAFLSGGIDSSITVAAMQRLGANPLKTYSIGFDDERFNELPFAREVAQHLGTTHEEQMVHAHAADIMPKMIEHLGEPMADNSIIPTFYVSQFARTGVTVALTGDGGDEVFGGYRRFYQIRRMEFLQRYGLTPTWRAMRKLTIAAEGLVNAKRRGRSFPASRADQMLEMQGMERYLHLLAFFPREQRERLRLPGFASRSAPRLAEDYLHAHWERPGGDDVVNRYLYLDMLTYMPEDILFKVDIASMANSLECRSPFLDHTLIELACSLPSSYKISPRGRHKHILKAAFADWLPPGFMDRPKQGFSAPLGKWLRGDLRPMVEAQLLSGRLAPWFDQKQIDTYVREHMSGQGSWSMQVWSLTVLSLWLEKFQVPVSA